MSFLAVPGIISGRTGWTPAALAPELWIRADLGHSYADTDAVAAIANQGTAGSAADLTQPTSGNRPYYLESVPEFNGQAVIDFAAASNQVLFAAIGNWWELPSESSSMTLVTVALCKTPATSGFEKLVTTRAASTQGGLDVDIRTGGSTRARVWSASGAATILDSGGNATEDTAHVLASVLTGAVATTPDSLALWVDGVSGGPTTANLAAAVAAAADREWVVGGTATTTGSLTGQIAEMIYLRRALTSDEDDALRDYLNDRYGLALAGVTQ